MAANPILENKRRQNTSFPSTHNISSREIESRRMGWGERRAQFTPPFSLLPWTMWGIEETIFNAVRAPLSQEEGWRKPHLTRAPSCFSIHLYPPFPWFLPCLPSLLLGLRLWQRHFMVNPEPLKNILTVRARRRTDPWESSPCGIWRPPPAWRRRRRRGEDKGAWENRPGYVRGRFLSTPHPKAMTVLRPARRGSYGAVVTSVRPPAPPTTPEPPNKHWSCSDRPQLPGWAPPQGACAYSGAPVCAGSVRGAGPWDNLTHPAAERESILRQFQRA